MPWKNGRRIKKREKKKEKKIVFLKLLETLEKLENFYLKHKVMQDFLILP